jgi:hypothetical protein
MLQACKVAGSIPDNVLKFSSVYLIPVAALGPLWSSGQRSWLQIQMSGFDSRRYQIFGEVLGLQRGPLSLVSTTEELLGIKISGSSQENREYGCRDPFTHDILCPQKSVLTSPTSSDRSVGIVRSLTNAKEIYLMT